jgi:hypothetical protein
LLPVPAGIASSTRENTLEKQNQQTGRVLLGMMIVSFLSGFIAAVFGFKERV